MPAAPQDEYRRSVGAPDAYSDLVVNSKSKSLFFNTTDRKFIIKSLSKQEATLLLNRLLPEYFKHWCRFPSSFLCKIVGLYKLSSRRGAYFLMAMRNVFANAPQSLLMWAASTWLCRRYELDERFLQVRPEGLDAGPHRALSALGLPAIIRRPEG